MDIRAVRENVNGDTRSATVSSRLGRQPALALACSFGLLLVALSGNAARANSAWAVPLFWLGILLFFLPAAMRVASEETTRSERLAIVALVGLGLYLVKLLHSPIGFTFHDELAHRRTASDILQYGRLFLPNTLIPTSALFPGLELATSALASMSGLPIFTAGAIVIGAARLILMLALYLLYETASGSGRIAGIGTLLYAANPSFAFFDAQFSYESLALPMAVFALFCVVRRSHTDSSDRRFGFAVAASLAIGALTVSHHITAYLLAGFLVVFAILMSVNRVTKGRFLLAIDRWAARASTLLRHTETTDMAVDDPGSTETVTPGDLALLAVTTSVAWFAYVALATLNYIYPYVAGTVREVWGIILGRSDARILFSSFSGQVTSLGEQLVGYASVILIVLLLPFGLIAILRHRARALNLTLALGVGVYLISLPLRLTYWGAELSNRASASLFVAVAFVLAGGAVKLGLFSPKRWRGRLLFSVWVAIVFAGQMVIGWPQWARMPGSYLVSADMRSVETQSIAAAVWARNFLDPDQRLSADRVNALLMGSYGEQRVVTVVYDGVLVAPVYFSSQFGPEEQSILREARVSYLLVDHRLGTDLPMTEVYFERGESDAYRHRTPISPTALAKFDSVPWVSKVFDSGDIAIYDVTRITYAP